MRKILQEYSSGPCPKCNGSMLRWCSKCDGTGVASVKNIDLINQYLSELITLHLQGLYLRGRPIQPF